MENWWYHGIAWSERAWGPKASFHGGSGACGYKVGFCHHSYGIFTAVSIYSLQQGRKQSSTCRIRWAYSRAFHPSIIRPHISSWKIRAPLPSDWSGPQYIANAYQTRDNRNGCFSRVPGHQSLCRAVRVESRIRLVRLRRRKVPLHSRLDEKVDSAQQWPGQIRTVISRDGRGIWMFNLFIMRMLNVRVCIRMSGESLYS